MATASTGTPARLRRTLTLWDLILYGVIVIQPVAPMSVFGVLSDRGHGHVVTTILIAMVAMLFTAISYGRMARAYPSAGSAFTYVGQEINPALGYVTGWSMVMDYMLNPMICIIWISQQAHVFAPGVPYGVWAVFFALVFTGLNIQGVKTSARVNTALAAGMGVVIAIFFVAAARYIFGNPHDGAAFFTRPFYDPQMWNTKAVLGGTSVAVLTYIGFDGISTLSEEAENPRRNILLATVLVCVVIGILSAVEGLRRAIDMARHSAFSQRGYSVHVRGWARLGTTIRHCGIHAGRRQFRIRHGSATRGCPIALWHGPEQRFAEVFFRRGGCQAARSPQQCAVRGCAGSGWGISSAGNRRRSDGLRTGRELAKLWRADRFHGSESGRIREIRCSRVGRPVSQGCGAMCDRPRTVRLFLRRTIGFSRVGFRWRRALGTGIHGAAFGGVRCLFLFVVESQL